MTGNPSGKEPGRWVGGMPAVILDFPTSVAPRSSEQPAWKVPAAYNILPLSCWSLHPLTSPPARARGLSQSKHPLWVAVERALEGSLPVPSWGLNPEA